MKFDDKNKMKEEAIALYLKGNNFSEIAKKLDCSRTFITNLIKDDDKIRQKRNFSTIKVYKNYKNRKMRLALSNLFLAGIGIDNDWNRTDYVDVFLDKENEQIIIKKHK